MTSPSAASNHAASGLPFAAEPSAAEATLEDIRLTASGDGAAYARLIRRYQQPMSRRMRHFARQPADLEELVHEVFVEAYFSLGRFRGEADFSHWLMRIATRVGYRYWKRRRRDADRRQSLESSAKGKPPAADSDAAAGAESAEAAEKLAALLEKLPPRDRLVVTLMYVEGHSVVETAALTGWSQTMVKVQAFRARGKLRKVLATTSV
jgi:RNA polymerase sigma-70 factor (ECF subfamily)